MSPYHAALPPPSALTARLAQAGRERRLLVGCDYDGTLAPFPLDPNERLMAASMRAVLEQLARRVPLAIVTGRAPRDARAMVGLPGLIYAGNHGAEIVAGPPYNLCHEVGVEHRPAIAALGEALAAELAAVPGVAVQRKGLSLSIHARAGGAPALTAAEAALTRLMPGYPTLIWQKMELHHEVYPRLDWDKGSALLYLAERLFAPTRPLLLFLGDGMGDEPAFACLGPKDAGILVQPEPRASAARYRLPTPHAVEGFLAGLAGALAG